MFDYVYHARIHSWNQPVLSNEGKVSCLRKQRGPLLGLELTTDRHPPTTSQTRFPLRHGAPKHWVTQQHIVVSRYRGWHRSCLEVLAIKEATTSSNGCIIFKQQIIQSRLHFDFIYNYIWTVTLWGKQVTLCHLMFKLNVIKGDTLFEKFLCIY